MQRSRFTISLLWVAVVALGAMVGCTRGEILDNIARAESIVVEESEEALRLMQSIPEGAVCGEHHRARYALVYSEALYHNYIDVESDTLTRTMAEYYLESDMHAERARALYQHALVKRQQ